MGFIQSEPFWKMESEYSSIMRWHRVINVDPGKLGMGIIFFKDRLSSP